MSSPRGDRLSAAADRLGALLADLPDSPWGDRPWHVEACSDLATDDCPCIISQGAYRAFDQAQAPPINYIADAETPELAAYLAAFHPLVGRRLLRLLHTASVCSYAHGHDGECSAEFCLIEAASAMADAILATPVEEDEPEPDGEPEPVISLIRDVDGIGVEERFTVSDMAGRIEELLRSEPGSISQVARSVAMMLAKKSQ